MLKVPKSVDGWWTDERIRPDPQDHASPEIPRKCAPTRPLDQWGFRTQADSQSAGRRFKSDRRLHIATQFRIFSDISGVGNFTLSFWRRLVGAFGPRWTRS